MTGPLPDADAFWQRLQDVMRSVPEEASTPPPHARVGAVLALFEATDDGPGMVLTRRRRDLRSHPGQLSFPGGRVDEGESVVQAALREAWEEIGLRGYSVEVAGTGPTFFIPPSRFWVVPVVGWWREPHELEPNPWEVDEVLHVPLAALQERERWRSVPLMDGLATWAWQLDDDLLWGATAAVIAALLEVVVEGWSGGLGPADLPAEREVLPWEGAADWRPRVVLEGVPKVPAGDVPTVTAEQARTVNRLLASAAHVEPSQVLEQAGRAVAQAVRGLVGGDVGGAAVTVVAGPGGTGAGGFAAARLLAAAGAAVTVQLVGAPRLPAQVDGLRAVDVPVETFDGAPATGDVVVDAVLGVGIRPPLEGPAAAVIEWLHRHDVPVVAVDLPSGIHPDEGIAGPCVTADLTVALGAPKPALFLPMCRPYVGDLYLADLGIPARVWREAAVAPVEVFGRGPVVRLVLAEDTPR